MYVQLTTAPSEKEKKALRLLWNSSYPESIALAQLEDVDAYLNGLSNCRHTFHWTDTHQEVLVAWFMLFERDGETWFAMIVNADFRRSGMGARLLHAAKQQSSVLNGWVIDHDQARMADGSSYPSPLSFYTRAGFEVLPEHRLETDRISAVKIRWQQLT